MSDHMHHRSSISRQGSIIARHLSCKYLLQSSDPRHKGANHRFLTSMQPIRTPASSSASALTSAVQVADTCESSTSGSARRWCRRIQANPQSARTQTAMRPVDHPRFDARTHHLHIQHTNAMRKESEADQLDSASVYFPMYAFACELAPQAIISSSVGAVGEGNVSESSQPVPKPE